MTTGKGRRIALLTGVALVVVLVGVAWACWDQILFRVRFESIGLNAQGCPEYRHRQTGIVFVRLPGGAFRMGSSKEEAPEQEHPPHKVALSPFLVAKHELSQSEWKRIMQSNPSRFKGDNLPVESVTWEDCQEFCGRTRLSLPTEAQWEYACRSGSGGAFFFGDGEAYAGHLAEYAWYGSNARGQTHPVGEKKPNAFGLHDVQGNVGEWCEDIFDREFYSKPLASRKDPDCTWGSGCRVLRGGSWRSSAAECRSTHRNGIGPSRRLSNVGLRPCYSLP